LKAGNTFAAKEKLRKKIADTKRNFSEEELALMSQEVFSVLEITGAFNDAKHICIYNSIPGEVLTADFINQWKEEKEFYLPAIENNEIVLRKIEPGSSFEKSQIGVYEPKGNNLENYDKIDLIIVPGIAFDRKGQRLGRGKGYYDRFLPKTKSTKIGICFDFQLFDQIPVDKWDVKMDIIVSENELIW